MIVTEFRKLSDDGLDQVVAATLTVEDDGTHRIEGDAQYVPLDLDVPVGGGRRVSFDDDPVAWSRLIRNELRTPYLTAVVVEDQ